MGEYIVWGVPPPECALSDRYFLESHHPLRVILINLILKGNDFTHTIWSYLL